MYKFFYLLTCNSLVVIRTTDNTAIWHSTQLSQFPDIY